jgi:hypothetical protein
VRAVTDPLSLELSETFSHSNWLSYEKPLGVSPLWKDFGKSLYIKMDKINELFSALSGKNQYGSDASLACESSLFL